MSFSNSCGTGFYRILAENVGALMEGGGSLKDIERSYKTYFEYSVPYSAPSFGELLKQSGLE